MTQKDFLSLLFNSGELTCFGPTIRATQLSASPKSGDCFFSINPMRDRRLDRNVTAFRNILVESDSLAPAEFSNFIGSMPYSTAVFSGGKSVHYIISLSSPCPDRAAYDSLVRRIYQALHPHVDTATSNPSRFSRLALAIRPENGKLQDLLELRSRIDNGDIEAWLQSKGVEENLGLARNSPIFFGNRNCISRRTIRYFHFGASMGQRNRELFAAACDALEHGYSPDELFTIAKNVPEPLPDSEIINTIKSAVKKVSCNLLEVI